MTVIVRETLVVRPAFLYMRGPEVTFTVCVDFYFVVDYIVEYDYDAVHDDELTIRVGEIIRNVKRLEEEGWLEGELNGKRGMFPDNFVKVSLQH